MSKEEREVVLQRWARPRSEGGNGAECDEGDDNVVAESAGDDEQCSAKRRWNQGSTREY
jgi:hypothetical protein